MSQRLLSADFRKSADIEFFVVPKDIVQDKHQGVIAIDLEAQGLVADLFYYSLPNMHVFLDLTMPGIKEGVEENGANFLNICLKEANISNIGNDVLLKDIVSTLQKIYHLDNAATMEVSVAPDDKNKGLTLCSIRYLMDTVARPLSLLARAYNPNDEAVITRVELLAHLIERRAGYDGYKSAMRLN